MIKEREINYDILRGLITVGVVMLHVFAKIQQNGNISYIQISLINTVCSLCVPCFFMLSGAFTLSKSNFSSSIIKIAGPAVIAILVYDLFSFQYLIRHGNSITIAVFEIIKNTIYGRPYYHLWFVYVIISLYAVSPLISKLKNNISHKNYAFLTIGFLVLAVIMGSYFKSDFEYGINSLKYIGYYMLGDVLYRRIKQGHFISYNRGVVIVITAFLCIFAAALSSYEMLTEIKIFPFRLLSTSSPFVMLSSIGLFCIFAEYHPKKQDNAIDKVLLKVAKKSYPIYLIHPLVIEIIFVILNRVDPYGAGLVEGFILTAITAMLSLGITKCIDRRGDKIDAIRK